MISFVWTLSANSSMPLVSGAGGSEMSTLGYVRELTRRGVECQVVTIGLGSSDGRDSAPDVSFVDFARPADVPELPGKTLLIGEPLSLATRYPPLMALWLPPYADEPRDFYVQGFTGCRLLTVSAAMVQAWSGLLEADPGSIDMVYPFADRVFGSQPAPRARRGPTKVLLAGRPTPQKGFYTLLEALHFFSDDDFEFTVVLAGRPGPDRVLVESIANCHPALRTVQGRATSAEMAGLLVDYDIVVVPTHPALHKEPFGMISVEAQHAGCRVVASDLGGLPETDCGGLHLFDAGDPYAMSMAIRAAAELGRLSDVDRTRAATRFTIADSTDSLLGVLEGETRTYPGLP